MNIYAFITPLVLLLLLFEIGYSVYKKNGIYNFQDTITNLGTGIGNQCVNLGVAFFVFKFYGFIYQYIPWKVPSTWYFLLLLLILQDFVFYWFHRIGHTLHIFWAAHMPHHSSEELNLSVGLRASFTQRIFQFLFFDWILVVFGFSPEMIYSMAAIHLFIAYWHHTQLINKLGWIEKIFVTPSHHRVHHGVNPEYIDKNFSEFLIIWDRIFGTFAKEEKPVCYGLTHPPRTWDPFYINIQYWKQLIDDAIAAPYFVDKLKIWFMPLTWRPRGLQQTDLIQRIGYDLEDQVKWTSKQFAFAKPYLIFQLLLGLIFMYFTINQQNVLTVTDRLLFSAEIMLMIYSWYGILEAKPWAIFSEIGRLLLMGSTFILVLHQHELITLIGWVSILTLLLVGASLLYISFFFRNGKTEGEAFALATVQ
ncbi:MAG: sterol desaturase family protein [Chitinophagales bacterium]|nr:sterol desaturase family protein [Chitinophagales bacterium]